MKNLIITSICIFFCGTIYSQQAIVPTGGDASNSSGSVSFTVGQIAYQSNSGSNGYEIQGVQQPWEISVVTEVEEASQIQLSMSVYPNPATDDLILEVKDFELSNLSFQLFDVQGRCLQNEKITDSQTKIVISNLKPATYFVKVIQGNKEIKVFKILKN